MDKLISIGKVLNFHGIKGEVKVGYTKGKEDRLENIRSVYININGEDRLYTIETLRFHKQNALIKFKEINSINEVETIKGLDIKISRADANNSLKEDEFFISDLIGLQVINSDEEKIGEIINIGSNGVAEILEIKDGNEKTHLVPFVKELVPFVSLKDKVVIINDIEGLIE